jgi:hypothetical protein
MKQRPSICKAGKYQYSEKIIFNYAWWCTHIIPAFRRLKQEDLEFEANLSYIVRHCLRTTTLKKITFIKDES